MKQLPVFCYGTLRNGFGNYHNILKGTTEKEKSGLIEGAIYPVRPSGGFPCLIEQEGSVVGELMYIKPELYDDTLARLDMLEGYSKRSPKNSMYIREKREIVCFDEKVIAWVYIWNRPTPRTEKIPSGCWKTFEQQSGFMW